MMRVVVGTACFLELEYTPVVVMGDHAVSQKHRKAKQQ